MSAGSQSLRERQGCCWKTGRPVLTGERAQGHSEGGHRDTAKSPVCKACGWSPFPARRCTLQANRADWPLPGRPGQTSARYRVPFRGLASSRETRLSGRVSGCSPASTEALKPTAFPHQESTHCKGPSDKKGTQDGRPDCGV